MRTTRRRTGRIFPGKIRVGVDDDFVRLPTGSSPVELGNRD